MKHLVAAEWLGALRDTPPPPRLQGTSRGKVIRIRTDIIDGQSKLRGATRPGWAAASTELQAWWSQRLEPVSSKARGRRREAAAAGEKPCRETTNVTINTGPVRDADHKSTLVREGTAMIAKPMLTSARPLRLSAEHSGGSGGGPDGAVQGPKKSSRRALRLVAVSSVSLQTSNSGSAGKKTP